MKKDRFLIVLGLIAVGWFAWFCASRGFFPLDQSIVFDGGFRVSQGQIPFRDFYLPHSLALVLLQGGVFSLLGTSYGSYLTVATVQSMLATIGSWLLLRVLSGPFLAPAFIASLLTAIWLIPPIGTPFADSGAFWGVLLALSIQTIANFSPSAKNSRLLAPLCACALAFSFFSKQSITLIWLPWFILSPLLLGTTTRAAVRWHIVMILQFLLFVGGLLGALASFSAWHSVWYWYFVLPGKIGLERVLYVFGSAGLLFGALAGCTVAALLLSKPGRSLRQILREAATRTPEVVWIGALAFYTVAISQLLRATMSNNPAVSDCFIGILLGGVALLLLRLVPQSYQRTLRATLAAVVLIVASFGIWFGVSRHSHESVMWAAFNPPFRSGPLAPLRWGNPTTIYNGELENDGIVVSDRELLNLVEYLTSSPYRFFIFPDFTLLYGLTGKLSPIPLLWFHRGLTYPESYEAGLDAELVAALERNDVRIVVLELESFFGTESRLRDFPRLSSWISEGWSSCPGGTLFSVRVRPEVPCPK